MATPDYLFIAALMLGCVLVAVALSAALCGRYCARLERTLAEKLHRLAVLERDFAAVLACARGVGNRIEAGERMQHTLQRQLDKLRHARSDGGQLAVEHAMKLLRGGSTLAEVKQVCDLSEGEAEILQNLARHRSAA